MSKTDGGADGGTDGGADGGADSRYNYDEYMKDLYLKNKFSCEVDKNPIGCRVFGDYTYKLGMPDKAAGAYKLGCERDKDDYCCYKYGVQQAQAKGTDLNFQEGEKNLEFACKKGIAQSCYALGMLKMCAEGKEAGVFNIRDSLYYHTLACDMDIPQACMEAGKLNWKGYTAFPELKQDSRKAFVQFKKACLRGSSGACETTAHMYKKGDGTEKDRQMAKKFLEYAKACKP